MSQETAPTHARTMSDDLHRQAGAPYASTSLQDIDKYFSTPPAQDEDMPSSDTVSGDEERSLARSAKSHPVSPSDSDHSHGAGAHAGTKFRTSSHLFDAPTPHQPPTDVGSIDATQDPADATVSLTPLSPLSSPHSEVSGCDNRSDPESPASVLNETTPESSTAALALTSFALPPFRRDAPAIASIPMNAARPVPPALSLSTSSPVPNPYQSLGLHDPSGESIPSLSPMTLATPISSDASPRSPSSSKRSARRRSSTTPSSTYSDISPLSPTKRAADFPRTDEEESRSKGRKSSTSSWTSPTTPAAASKSIKPPPRKEVFIGPLSELESAAAAANQAASKTGAGTGAFVFKVYHMLLDPASEGFIEWAPHGRSFYVSNASVFAKSILPQYFKHNNFSSFVRQLNMYGFHKMNKSGRTYGEKNKKPIDDASQIWEFSHDLFVRGKPDQVEQIKRRHTEPESPMRRLPISTGKLLSMAPSSLAQQPLVHLVPLPVPRYDFGQPSHPPLRRSASSSVIPISSSSVPNTPGPYPSPGLVSGSFSPPSQRSFATTPSSESSYDSPVHISVNPAYRPIDTQHGLHTPVETPVESAAAYFASTSTSYRTSNMYRPPLFLQHPSHYEDVQGESMSGASTNGTHGSPHYPSPHSSSSPYPTLSNYPYHHVPSDRPYTTAPYTPVSPQFSPPYPEEGAYEEEGYMPPRSDSTLAQRQMADRVEISQTPYPPTSTVTPSYYTMPHQHGQIPATSDHSVSSFYKNIRRYDGSSQHLHGLGIHAPATSTEEATPLPAPSHHRYEYAPRSTYTSEYGTFAERPQYRRVVPPLPTSHPYSHESYSHDRQHYVDYGQRDEAHISDDYTPTHSD